MAISPDFRHLVDANAPLWAGEAAVFRGSWDSPQRSRATDRLWLSRQCRKEFWENFEDGAAGPFLGPVQRLRKAFDKIDRGIDRHEVLAIAEILQQEFSHYCAFADIYDTIRDEAEPPLDPHRLKKAPNWPENAELARLRAEHREAHGEIGLRACFFTEGGYGTLFTEGMKLKGRGDVDDLIADACSKVYNHEFRHMLKGIVGLDAAGTSEADWALLAELTVAQMKCRVRMRNAQFSHPLSEERVREIFAGKIEPLPFDYDTAARIAG